MSHKTYSPPPKPPPPRTVKEDGAGMAWMLGLIAISILGFTLLQLIVAILKL